MVFKDDLFVYLFIQRVAKKPRLCLSIFKMEKYLSAAAVAVLIFAVASIQSVKGETFYIVTTPDSPFCNGSAGSESGYDGAMNRSGEGQQCLTLPQFIARFISNEISPTNVTLELEPGEHILDSNLTMTTVISFAMISEAATINCTSPDFRYFYLYSVEDALISGITFMDCGQIGVFNTDRFRFENSSFQVITYDQPYSLVLMSVVDSAITGSTFTQNRYNGVLYIGNGSSIVHIQHCMFSHLKNYPRAIYSVNSTIVVIDSSMFEDITSEYYDENNGSVIEIVSNKENVTLKNCDFINNTIGNGSHALVSIDGLGSIMVHGNRFIQNAGRVLHISSVNETTIDHNSFVDNTGPGAALDINAKGVPLKISGNNFTHNTNGAVYLLVSDSSVTVRDCSFSSNTKSGNGGAAMTVYEHDDDYRGYGSNILKISQSSFFNNSANINASGGALHIRVDSPSSEVFINSSVFSRNRAQQAGAVYIEAPANCSFAIFVTTFDNNTATEGHAGAVAIEGEIQHIVLILNSTFTSNTAPDSYAGAVYIDAADTDMTGSTFLNNLARKCGALALSSGYIEIRDSTFTSNRAMTDGGVICTYAGMNRVSIYSGNFSHNRAEGNGGVMIIEPLANEGHGNKIITFLIQDSSYFDHNTAGSQGGVFAIFVRSEFLVGTSLFDGNQAGVEGGVMYVRDTNSSVSIMFDSQLSFNSAARRGGVISINGSTLFISNSHIFNNSADVGAVISACKSDVSTFPPDILYQQNDPHFPNCVLYDVVENRPTTAVTTPTVPPTSAKHSNGIAVAVAIPIGCLLLALIIAAVFVFAYWRGYIKCKKPDSVGRYGVKKSESDDPDLAPLMDNA